MFAGEYVREALKRGLLLEAQMGVNPYKFGLIGSTDSHTGLATGDEDNFFGKHTGTEPSAARAMAERRAKNEMMVVATSATRFAAKEACSKALGTGIRHGVWWRDMGVVNLPGGRPTMQLTGGAAERLKALTPAGHDARIDLSITDDWPLAQAFVIISAVSLATS
ncbi:DUF3604 domain-containing protein [Bradyrhizobium sp.]|uniref:holo-ACP synthase n=1 Tax=Bradyrhizobium sp. TaxID=376 RepID=UPI00391D92BA